MALYDVVIIKSDGKRALIEADLSGSLVNAVIEDVTCDSSVYVKSAVRMTSGGVAVNALADSLDNSNVLGVVENKSSSTLCTVRVSGVTLDHWSGLDVTKEYFLSDTVAGEITTTVPIDTDHVKIKIGQPFDGERLFFSRGERVVRS